MLKKIILNSKSNDILNEVSSKMSGKTFHHHYHMLYDIRTFLGEEKKIYTEIGTYCGGSLSLMLMHNFDTEIYCIDPLYALKNQEEILNENINKFNLNKKKVTIYKDLSTNTSLIENLKQNNFKTDILFIDGEQTHKAVLSDFYNYEIFVNKGGFIIFDDYLDYKYSPQVKPAVDEIISTLDKSKYNIIGIIPNYKDALTYGYDEKFLYLNEFVIEKLVD